MNVNYNEKTNDYTIEDVSREELKLIYDGLWLKQRKLEKKSCKISAHDKYDKFCKFKRKSEMCQMMRFNSDVELGYSKKGKNNDFVISQQKYLPTRKDWINLWNTI